MGGNNACAPAVRRDSSHGEKPSQQRQQAVADICNDVRDNMRSERPKRDGSKSRDPSSSFAYLDPGIGVMEMQIRFTMCDIKHCLCKHALRCAAQKHRPHLKFRG